MANPLYIFGSGTAWATPISDSQGNAISNPAPVLVAGAQDISIDGSADIKELFGQNSWALVVARGKQKLSIKMKNAQLNGRLWNSLYFGQTLTAGLSEIVYDAVGSTVPGTPYQVTPTVPGSGTWAYGLGVRDSNNLALGRVASSPTTGQYSVSAGVYTFAAADTTKSFFIDYAYTATSTVAQKLVVANQLMGQSPLFQLDIKLANPLGGSTILTFPSCVATKFTIATKLDDFTYPEFDISAFAPGQSSPFTIAWAQ